MTQKRPPRRSRRHRGVKLLTLADGRNVARWRDPISRKQQQQSLDVLGLTTREARVAWAMNKAATIGQTRAAVTSGVAMSTRVGVAAAVNDYLERFTNRGTKQNKQIALEAFATWCGGVGLRDAQDITPVHLVRWREQHYRAASSNHATSTRNRWAVAVAVFCNWLRSQGMAPLLTADAVRDGLRREKEPREAIEILRPPEIRRLLQACQRHDAEPWVAARMGPPVLLALLTGMRSAEVRLLRWAEIDLEAGEIRLPAARTKTQTARVVDLRICPTAVAMLAAMRLRAPQVDTVFADLTIGRLEAGVRRLVGRFGAPGFTMHALRRTCGTITTCAPGIFGAASAYMSARRLGHAVDVAERHYLGVLTIDQAARTIEAAAGIEDIAQEIAGVAPAQNAAEES